MKFATTAWLFIFTVLSAPTWASNLVTFQVTAVVDNVDDPFGIIGSNIMAGDSLTGIWQYDRDLVDNDPDPKYGEFSADPPGDNFINGTNEGSSFYQTSLFMLAFVENDPLFSQSFFFLTSGDTTPSLVDHPDVDYVDLEILLVDDDSTAFVDDGLPADLVLADFEIKNLVLSGDTMDPNTGGHFTPFAVYATITGLTRVPEPSTIILTSLAGLFLASHRRRN
ncbi:PEP-CTERM sorting domain-containing protein [Pirellulales bacterium]|nr:PEP-CTERM sorting domain-containing protein [Pirellulales bacterium]